MRKIVFGRWIAGIASALTLAAGCAGADPEPSATASESPTTAESPPPESPTTESPASPESTEATSPTPGGEPGAGPPKTPEIDGTVAEGFTTPWGLTFASDGTALVSERDTGLIRRIDTDGRVETVGEVSDVVPSSEGGLLGIALADDTLFAYFSSADDNRVVRMAYDGESLGEPEVILDGFPQAAFHDGGRLAVGPDGFLYVATGDGTRPESAQEMDSLGGKILRVTFDGEPAPGNPFGDDSPVWSMGHRNVQGLAFDDEGRLWASEFGQDAWDELNLIEPGSNYGWPQVEGMSEDGQGGDFVDPVHTWRPEDASPSGLAYADGSLWMAALRGNRLWRIDLDGAEPAGKPRAFFEGEYGRLRTVVTAPDGSLWLTTSNTDGPNRPNSQHWDTDQILRVALR